MAGVYLCRARAECKNGGRESAREIAASVWATVGASRGEGPLAESGTQYTGSTLVFTPTIIILLVRPSCL